VPSKGGRGVSDLVYDKQLEGFQARSCTCPAVGLIGFV